MYAFDTACVGLPHWRPLRYQRARAKRPRASQQITSAPSQAQMLKGSAAKRLTIPPIRWDRPSFFPMLTKLRAYHVRHHIFSLKPYDCQPQGTDANRMILGGVGPRSEFLLDNHSNAAKSAARLMPQSAGPLHIANNALTDIDTRQRRPTSRSFVPDLNCVEAPRALALPLTYTRHRRTPPAIATAPHRLH